MGIKTAGRRQVGEDEVGSERRVVAPPATLAAAPRKVFEETVASMPPGYFKVADVHLLELYSQTLVQLRDAIDGEDLKSQHTLGGLFRGYARDLRLTKQAQMDRKVAGAASSRGTERAETLPPPSLDGSAPKGLTAPGTRH